MTNTHWLMVAVLAACSTTVGCSDDDDDSVAGKAGSSGLSGVAGGTAANQAGRAGHAGETTGSAGGGAGATGGSAVRTGGNAGAATLGGQSGAGGSSGGIGAAGASGGGSGGLATTQGGNAGAASAAVAGGGTAAGRAGGGVSGAGGATSNAGGHGGSSGASASAGVAGQGGGVAVQTQGATVTVVCTSSGAGCDPPSGGTVAATTLSNCSYTAADHRLWVKFVGTGVLEQIELLIANFSGDGSYHPDVEGNTDVIAVGGNMVSAGSASGPPLRDCTIAITSNFAQIQVPASGDAEILDLTAEVVCPQLSAGGICDNTCSVNPGTFSLSVKGCVVAAA